MMAADVYDRILRMVSKEAVRMSKANPNGPGPGGCAGAIMSTLIFAWADMYGESWESVIDTTARTAKETLRLKRESEAATRN